MTQPLKAILTGIDRGLSPFLSPRFLATATPRPDTECGWQPLWTELQTPGWVICCMKTQSTSLTLLQALQQFQRGHPNALWARLQATHLSLNDVTSIQQYVWLSQPLRRSLRSQQALPELHYRLFVAFNLRVAQADIAQGGRYRPFKIRMFVLKYLAKQCFAGQRGPAKRRIGLGVRRQGWPAIADRWAETTAA